MSLETRYSTPGISREVETSLVSTAAIILFRLLAQQQAANTSHLFPGSTSTGRHRSSYPTAQDTLEPRSDDVSRRLSGSCRELPPLATNRDSLSACSRPPDRQENSSPASPTRRQAEPQSPSCSPASLSSARADQGKFNGESAAESTKASVRVDEIKFNAETAAESVKALGSAAAPNESTPTCSFSRIPKPRARRRASSSSAPSSFHPSSPPSCNSSATAPAESEFPTGVRCVLPPLTARSAVPPSEHTFAVPGAAPFTLSISSYLPPLSGTPPLLPTVSNDLPSRNQSRCPVPREACRLSTGAPSARIRSPVSVVLSGNGAEANASETAEPARKHRRHEGETSTRQRLQGLSRGDALGVSRGSGARGARNTHSLREAGPQGNGPDTSGDRERQVDGSGKQRASFLGFSKSCDKGTVSQSRAMSAGATQSWCTKSEDSSPDTYDDVEDKRESAGPRGRTPTKSVVCAEAAPGPHKGRRKRPRCAKVPTNVSGPCCSSRVEEVPRIPMSASPTRSTGEIENGKHLSPFSESPMRKPSRVSPGIRGRRASTATGERAIHQKETLGAPSSIRERVDDTAGQSSEIAKRDGTARPVSSFLSFPQRQHGADESGSKSDGSSSSGPALGCECETSSSSDSNQPAAKLSYKPDLQPHDATCAASPRSSSALPSEEEEGPYSPKLRSPKSVAKPTRAHSSSISVRFAPPPIQRNLPVSSELPSSCQKLSRPESSSKKKGTCSRAAPLPTPVSRVSPPVHSSSPSSCSSSYSSVHALVAQALPSPPPSDVQSGTAAPSLEKKETNNATAPACTAPQDCQAGESETSRSKDICRASVRETKGAEHSQATLVLANKPREDSCQGGSTSSKEGAHPISRPSSSRNLRDLLAQAANSSQSLEECPEDCTVATHNSTQVHEAGPWVTGPTQGPPAAEHREIRSNTRCLTTGAELGGGRSGGIIVTSKEKSPSQPADAKDLRQGSFLLDSDAILPGVPGSTTTVLHHTDREPSSFLARQPSSQEDSSGPKDPLPSSHDCGEGVHHTRNSHPKNQEGAPVSLYMEQNPTRNQLNGPVTYSNHDEKRREVRCEDGVPASSRRSTQDSRDQYAGASPFLPPEIPNKDGGLLISDKRRARSCEEALVLAAERAFGLTWKEAVRAVKKKGSMWEEIQRIFSKDAPRFYAGLRLWAEDVLAGKETTSLRKEKHIRTARQQTDGVSAGIHSESRSSPDRKNDASRPQVGGLLENLVEGVGRDWKKLSIVLEIFRRGKHYRVRQTRFKSLLR